MEKFTTEELLLLNLAGPVFTTSSKTDSNACNLKIKIGKYALG